jgi:hypothetical protein
MREAAAGLSAILDIEMNLHMKLCAGWGLSPSDLEQTPPAVEMLAYIQHSWKWLGEAERWKDLAHRETAFRFHGEHAGPMTMGPNSMEGDRRTLRRASQLEGKNSPLE